MTKDIEELRGAHAGQLCWIVGKGASLANVNVDMFGPGPIIALNHAARKITYLRLPNVTYSMQKDGAWPHVNDTGVCPNKCTEIVDEQCPRGQTYPSAGQILLVHKWHSFCCWPDYEPRYMFDSEKFDQHHEIPSVVCAMEIASLFGCKTIVMVAFDGIVCSDNRNCYDGLSLIKMGSMAVVTQQPAFINTLMPKFENIFWLSPGQSPLKQWVTFYRKVGGF